MAASLAAPPPRARGRRRGRALDGRGGFVGGAAASGAGFGGAAIGRAFDRGATAPRSNDLKIPKITLLILKSINAVR